MARILLTFVAIASLSLNLAAPRQKLEGPAQLPVFKEGAREAGLGGFLLQSGTPEKKYIMETMPAGVCLLDYDADGLVDIYLVNGGFVEDFRKGARSAVKNALFRNLGGRRFQDVTAEAGVAGNGYWGMGCSVTDYDADGRLDLYVTNYGSNILYRNLGNGHFEDATQKAGVDDTRWSAGSAWADFDRDGDLDLFVSNYIDLDRANLPEPGSPDYGVMGSSALGCQYRSLPVSCGPGGMKGAGDSFFVNQGNGTFREQSKAHGLDDPQARYGLGALWSDLDSDGWPDLYVANDGGVNFLHHNLGNGSFEDIGLISGAGVRENGAEQSSMGVAVGDYLNHGRLALLVTNFAEDYCTLYRNEGNLNFTDVSESAGLAVATLPFVNWGTFFLDYDNDGWTDIFASSGHVFPQADEIHSPTIAPYRERSLLFRNLANGRFQEIAEKSGLSLARVGRGAATADLDNDGCLDIVVNNLDENPCLFWNACGSQHHYISVQLKGAVSQPLPLGSRVRVKTGDTWQLQELLSGGSYLSQNDLRLHFGLGRAQKADTIEIRWPNGKTTVLRDVPADQILRVTEK